MAGQRYKIPKGTTPNPNGRPKKGFSLTEAMKEYLATTDPVTKKTRQEQLIEKTHEQALAGDATSKKLIWNYLEGMPKQQVDHTSGGEKIVPIYGGLSIKGLTDGLSGHDSDQEDISTQ